jgi:hypothetical protein
MYALLAEMLMSSWLQYLHTSIGSNTYVQLAEEQISSVLNYFHLVELILVPDNLGPEAAAGGPDDGQVVGDGLQRCLQVALVRRPHHRSLHVEGHHHAQGHRVNSLSDRDYFKGTNPYIGRRYQHIPLKGM